MKMEINGKYFNFRQAYLVYLLLNDGQNRAENVVYSHKFGKFAIFIWVFNNSNNVECWNKTQKGQNPPSNAHFVRFAIGAHFQGSLSKLNFKVSFQSSLLGFSACSYLKVLSLGQFPSLLLYKACLSARKIPPNQSENALKCNQNALNCNQNALNCNQNALNRSKNAIKCNVNA